MTAIYTRTGDTGSSGLIGNERRPKSHPIFDAIGCIDEASSHLGWCLTVIDNVDVAAALRQIQSDLFTIGASLADTDHELPTITAERVAALEKQIDVWWSATPPLTRFILPGGDPGAAALHVARTIVRRAERSLAHVADFQPVDTNVIAYMNRLSDYLFAGARFLNATHGVREHQWIPPYES